ncbi:MAG: hydrogenase maturation protease [Desulfatirhabdiaceae bacterium]
METIVLGIGNLLMGDDGVGVHAAIRLCQEGISDAEVVEVGTAILDALPLLETADRIIVMDAIRGGNVPGTLYRLPLADCAENTAIASVHGLSLIRVLSLHGKNVPDGVVLGVEPDYLGWSMSLSPVVRETLPVLLNAVREEVIRTPRNGY